MGIADNIRSQFVDVIELEDQNPKLIVTKYSRLGNEIKQNSKVIVREGQCAVFLKGGSLADVLPPGTWNLTTENLPVLSTLGAIGYGFNSPIKSDLYFVSTKQIIENTWGTKNPIAMRDELFNMVRVRAFGTFAFRITDPALFMREVFAAQNIVMSYDVMLYVTGIITQSVAYVFGSADVPILDFAVKYREFSDQIVEEANKKTAPLGIAITGLNVENVSLPDEVEKLIDEQSGIGMASKDMDTFMQYQTARAMRDAAAQEGGLAGLGAGLATGAMMAEKMTTSMPENSSTKAATDPKDAVATVRELKTLVDEGILTQEEFEAKKKELLNL